MEALKSHLVKSLQDAREELLSIKPTELSHTKLIGWHRSTAPTLLQANRIGSIHSNSYIQALQGHEQSPYEVLVDLRAELVRMLDENRLSIDRTQIIESVLESNIKKVKDPKLSTLLLEFNGIKDAQPNAAAVIFRTIVSLVIHERAKLKAPHSGLATRTDFNLKPTIEDALKLNLFDKGDVKFLQLFLPSGKAIFDNVAHSAGANALVDKQHLSTMVEPLNKLLATIV